ncbi:MAG TPA: hypothetical protein DCS56_04060, partial [Alcanivorax sp.]|nr:hypothetical protein [Alcanivorax sp.]
MTWLLRLTGAAAVLVLGGIIAVLLIQSAPFMLEHGSALWRNDWQPGQARYGMAAMIAGSIVVSVLALVIAGPVAVLLAAWLRYFAPSVRR